MSDDVVACLAFAAVINITFMLRKWQGDQAGASEGPVAFQVALDIYFTKDSFISRDRNEHFKSLRMPISAHRCKKNYKHLCLALAGLNLQAQLSDRIINFSALHSVHDGKLGKKGQWHQVILTKMNYLI